MMSANKVQVADIYMFTRNEFIRNENMEKIKHVRASSNMQRKKNERNGRNIYLSIDMYGKRIHSHV